MPEVMSTDVIEPPTYLIVDNSPLSLKWHDRVLRNIGSCEVIEASDGTVAIERLATAGARVDAIISDLRMPNMNGLELLKQVRLARTGAIQNVPFLIVTDFAERACAGLALSLDVDAFLARPVKQRALNRHLVRTRAERRAVKTAVEAEATYGSVDLTGLILPHDPLDEQAEAPAAAEEPDTAPHGPATADDGRLLPLASVPEGTRLARDAVNSAGAVLVRAGEEITGSLKAVLLSYAEIDESLANVWVSPRDPVEAS